MKTTFISTLSLSSTLRGAMLRAQGDLVTAQKEVTTGRFADVGLSIGVRTGQTVGLREQFARLGGIVDTNALIMTRLDTSQAALDGMLETAQDFLATLVGLRNGSGSATVLVTDATNNLQGAIASLNASASGQYLFGGINTQTKPVTDYFETPPPASKLAVDAALVGINAASTAADVTTALTGPFAAAFASPDWNANWSAAADEPVSGRISPTEVLDVSVSANEQAFRDLLAGYTMMVEAGSRNLNPEAFTALADTAIQKISSAIQGVTALKARLGTVQERITRASERLEIQQDIVAKQVQTFEGVDQYEASTRLTMLTTQVETSYALTARIQKLSILNYMR